MPRARPVNHKSQIENLRWDCSKSSKPASKNAGQAVHEIKRIVTRSQADRESLEELEAALLGADLGMAMTTQIVAAVKKAYESQGQTGLNVFGVARGEVERSLSSNQGALHQAASGPPWFQWLASTARAKPPRRQARAPACKRAATWFCWLPATAFSRGGHRANQTLGTTLARAGDCRRGQRRPSRRAHTTPSKLLARHAIIC